MSDQPRPSVKEVAEGIRALARAEGVFRPDLVAVLDGKARFFRDYFRINTRNNGLKDIRFSVRGFLAGLFTQITSPGATSANKQAERSDVFQYTYWTNFNLDYKLVDDSPIPKLIARRKSLERERGIDQAMAGRDLEHAANEIARLLLSGRAVAVSGLPADAISGSASLATPEDEKQALEPHENGYDELSLEGAEGSPSKRNRVRWSLIVGTVVVLAAAGIGAVPTHAYGLFAASGSSQTADSPTNSNLDLPPVLLPVTVQDGNLRLTLSYMDSGGGSGNVGFADQQHGYSNEAQAGLALANADLSKYLADELAAGGYLLLHGSIQVDVEGLSDQKVTIHDIRPVNLVRHPVADARVNLVPSQGTETDIRMAFLLDSQNPVPLVEDQSGTVGGPFFAGNQSLTFVRGEQHTIALDFQATRQAVEFDIAVNYEAGGTLHELVLRDGQLPFRVSGVKCGTGNEDVMQQAKGNPAAYSAVDFHDGPNTGFCS